MDSLSNDGSQFNGSHLVFILDTFNNQVRPIASMLKPRAAHQVIYVPPSKFMEKREQDWIFLEDQATLGCKGFVYAVGGCKD